MIRFKFLQKVRDDGLVAPLCGVMQWCHFILKRADIDGKFQPFKLKTSYWCNSPHALQTSRVHPWGLVSTRDATASTSDLYTGAVTCWLAWFVISIGANDHSATESKYFACVYWCFISENKAYLSSYQLSSFLVLSFPFPTGFRWFPQKKVCAAKSIRTLL